MPPLPFFQRLGIIVPQEVDEGIKRLHGKFCSYWRF
jgi:hypothetical protein